MSISASVGKNGVNNRADVEVVQRLINDNIWRLTPLRPLVVNGQIGKDTIGAIEKFQFRFGGMQRPDGRVDPNGCTLRFLKRDTALNGHCFCNPKWVNAARGYDPAISGWPEYNGGIETPKQVHLRIGQRYFRFANSKTPREQAQLGGGWWVEYETLKTIANFARQHATPREAARYLLGLPREWTECDTLVHGILEKPLDAFRGKGKPARSKKLKQAGAHPADRGTIYIPPQHLVVMQLYIPDLASVRERAFPNPTTEDVWTSSYFKS